MLKNNRIPWYYIWSDKYEIFHTIFQDISSRIYPVLREEFAIRPLFIEQSEFQKKLSTNTQEHPFSGCNLKIDALIKCIEENIGTSFLFTDIDIIIRQPTIKHMLKPFQNYDMTFMTEELNTQLANIGFCYINANSNTLKFWKQVQEIVTKDNAHDQTVVNELLKETDLKVGFFSEKDIISQKTCTPNADFKIVQILSSGNNTSHWQLIEKLYTLPIFVNLNPYRYLISEEQRHDIKQFEEKVNSEV